MKKIIYFLLLSIVSFFSCEPTGTDDSDNNIPEEKEYLEITALQVLETGGVKFEAAYEGTAKIGSLKSGFLVARNETPTASNAQDITGATSQNLITGESGKDFIYNEQYYVRAYIVHSQEKIQYSEAKSFVSLGSKAPEVNSINRSLILDTVTIRGSNFTTKKQFIKVEFGTAPGTVVEANDTIIQCIVPANLERFDPLINVEVYGKKDTYEEFSLITPNLEKLSKNVAALGDTLTLYGSNFDIANQRNTITVGNVDAQILHSTRDSIQFVLPERLSTSTLDLKLITQLQESVLPKAITIKEPVITGFPISYKAYEIIEIRGEHFSIFPEDNKIFFNDLPAEVLEASRTKLKVRIPIGPYQNRYPEVRIELLDYNSVYDGDFTLSDMWLLKSRINSGYTFRGSKHFIHNNRAYLFEKDYLDGNRWIVHVMDPTTDSWSEFYVNFPRPELRSKDYTIIYNRDSGRIFFYFSNDVDNFYEFSPDTKNFSLRSDFPGVERGIPATFSIDNQLYLGLGRFMDWGYQDRESLSHFWSYNIHSDLWEQVATFPQFGERSDLSVFVIDGEAYLGNGASTTGEDDFWKYSPATNEWIKLGNFPGARTYTSYFEYGGKAYVYYGGGLTGDPAEVAFEYDPTTNAWTVIDPVNEIYYTYFNYPEGTYALRFDNAVYLGITRYPHIEFFKVDLDRL